MSACSLHTLLKVQCDVPLQHLPSQGHRDTYESARSCCRRQLLGTLLRDREIQDRERLLVAACRLHTLLKVQYGVHCNRQRRRRESVSFKPLLANGGERDGAHGRHTHTEMTSHGTGRPPSGFTVPTRAIGGPAVGSDSEAEVASLMQRFPSASQGACLRTWGVRLLGSVVHVRHRAATRQQPQMLASRHPALTHGLCARGVCERAQSCRLVLMPKHRARTAPWSTARTRKPLPWCVAAPPCTSAVPQRPHV